MKLLRFVFVLGVILSFALSANASDLQVLTFSGPPTGVANTNVVYTATFANVAAYGAGARPWAASEVLSLNTYRSPTASNGHTYKVTTAGTANSSEPTWPLTAGGTVTDGSVVWTEQGCETENTTIIFNFSPTNVQTFQSITKPSTFTCTTPSVNAWGAITCTNSTWAGTETWTAGQVIVLNQVRYPTTPNGHWYKATTAGTTSGSTEPTWPTGGGSTVNDGSVTWTEIGTDTFTITMKIASGTSLWTYCENWVQMSFAASATTNPDNIDENDRLEATTRVNG